MGGKLLVTAIGLVVEAESDGGEVVAFAAQQRHPVFGGDVHLLAGNRDGLVSGQDAATDYVEGVVTLPPGTHLRLQSRPDIYVEISKLR